MALPRNRDGTALPEWIIKARFRASYPAPAVTGLPARAVDVTIEYHPGELRLAVRDDGRGMAAAPAPGPTATAAATDWRR